MRGWIEDRYIYLVEGKTNNNVYQAKMILKTHYYNGTIYNLKNVKVGDKNYIQKPVVKLTSKFGFDKDQLKKEKLDFLKTLRKEARKIILNIYKVR